MSEQVTVDPNKDDPFTLFGGTLGDWGKGLSGVGSIVSGFNDFRNFGEQKKNMNRNWDLSLGNFANQAQVVNNAQENDIRSRLSNAGMASGPELDAAVAAELARTGVATDPYAAQQNGTQNPAAPQIASNSSSFMPNMPAGSPQQPQAPQQQQQQGPQSFSLSAIKPTQQYSRGRV